MKLKAKLFSATLDRNVTFQITWHFNNMLLPLYLLLFFIANLMLKYQDQFHIGTV